MSYLWYPLCAAIAAAWVHFDARNRHDNRYWAVATFIAGPVGLSAYLARRPLREGESREGGRAWQFFSMLIVSWTALSAMATLSNFFLPYAETVSIAIGWAVVALPGLIVGLALKRNSTEHGPTGALGAMALWYSGPETTADGRAYICRECGNQYAVELPFCDRCGAWPGQSG